MREWTDPTGKSLADYERPSIAVDVAVLTYLDEMLGVVVVERESGALALPGTFLHARERLAEAADRGLRDKTGLTDITFHQLAMFDDPDRDERGWVVSMAHTAVLSAHELPEDTLVVPVHDRDVEQELAFDHAEMVRLAVDELRARYAQQVDPARLLGEEFTILELRRLYEMIYARTLQKDAFRRQVVDALDPTGRMSAPTTGRPAELFRRRGQARLPASAWALFTG